VFRYPNPELDEGPVVPDQLPAGEPLHGPPVVAPHHSEASGEGGHVRTQVTSVYLA